MSTDFIFVFITLLFYYIFYIYIVSIQPLGCNITINVRIMKILEYRQKRL